jgi:hypothetical protein
MPTSPDRPISFPSGEIHWATRSSSAHHEKENSMASAPPAPLDSPEVLEAASALLHAHFAELGRRGGRASRDRGRLHENLAKAREAFEARFTDEADRARYFARLADLAAEGRRRAAAERRAARVDQDEH